MAFKITIITPVYNGADYIEETVLSVFSNIPSEFTAEYIVVNDGSTDTTSAILSRFREYQNFHVINQENAGECVAVNKALNAAKGEFILVVNADDPMFSPELIPKSIDVLTRNQQIVCTYPDWQIIDDNGEILETRIVKEYSEIELIGKFNCLPGPGSIFRKDAALSIGGRRNWKFVSDYDFWLRLSRLGGFQRVPGVMSQWRQHKNSTSVSAKSFEMALERINVTKSFVESNTLGDRERRMALSSAYYFAARLGVFSREIPARKWTIKSFMSARGWPTVANPFVVLFIFTLPISRHLLRLVAPFSVRLRNVF